MDISKLVKSLSDNEKKELCTLLAVNNEELKANKLAQEAEKVALKTSLLAKVEAYMKKYFPKENQKKQVVEFDLKLKFTLNPNLMTAESAKSYISNGNQPYINFSIEADVRNANGKKAGRQIAFLNQHVNDMVDGACDEVLELFPEFKEHKTQFDKETAELAVQTNQYSRKYNEYLSVK